MPGSEMSWHEKHQRQPEVTFFKKYISGSGFYGIVGIIYSQFDIGIIGWSWPIFEGASPLSIHNTHSVHGNSDSPTSWRSNLLNIR